MIIYNNGCSHTKTGEDFFSHGYFDIVCKELFNNDYQSVTLERGLYNYEKNKLLKLKLNSTNILFKHALSGKSNDLIFFETLNFIYTTLDTELKPNLIIIQWSGPNRRFHSEPDGGIIDINPHDNTDLGIKFEPLATEQTLQYMITLQDVCKLHNIEFIFIPYMELDKDVSETSPITNQLNLDKFTTSLIEGHRNFFRESGYSMDLQGHPNFYGIYYIAKLILKILNKDIGPIENYIETSDIDKSKKQLQNFIKKYGSKLGEGVLENIKKIKDLI